MSGNPSGPIGTDLYNQRVNNRIKELDMRFALNNAFTPLVNDYSGLRGGTRPRKHIMSGNSSSKYPILYPESLAVTAGKRGSSIHSSQMYKDESEFLHPTNGVYPAIPLKHPISKRKPKVGAGRKHGMHSLTHPHELDYTTKKSSKVHHIAGHYVRSMPRPFVAGKRHAPSLKDIGNALKPSHIKHSFQKLGNTIKSDYRKTSPTFKKYARAVIPATTGFLGASLGGLVGEVGGPLGSAVGATLGGMGGQDVGHLINRKIGLGRKPRTKKAPSHRGQMISQLMREHGMTLGQASAHIKQHGLY